MVCCDRCCRRDHHRLGLLLHAGATVHTVLLRSARAVISAPSLSLHHYRPQHFIDGLTSQGSYSYHPMRQHLKLCSPQDAIACAFHPGNLRSYLDSVLAKGHLLCTLVSVTVCSNCVHKISFLYANNSAGPNSWQAGHVPRWCLVGTSTVSALASGPFPAGRPFIGLPFVHVTRLFKLIMHWFTLKFWSGDGMRDTPVIPGLQGAKFTM